MDRRNNDEGNGAQDGELQQRFKISEYISNLPKMFESIDEEVKAAVIPPNADEETKKRLYADLQICKDNVMTKILKAMEMAENHEYTRPFIVVNEPPTLPAQYQQ
ncbi:uncharacterized protein LOC124543222 [Vanessa cardui]|uniref:uncharacterized protein LOC124543222 n=1 Tax=Vanessa cardui TaxID=171605 RepID=UPI001F137C08|nr:uncharacterized protein LOC124543222 [Vanessa cardui]